MMLTPDPFIYIHAQFVWGPIKSFTEHDGTTLIPCGLVESPMDKFGSERVGLDPCVVYVLHGQVELLDVILSVSTVLYPDRNPLVHIGLMPELFLMAAFSPPVSCYSLLPGKRDSAILRDFETWGTPPV